MSAFEIKLVEWARERRIARLRPMSAQLANNLATAIAGQGTTAEAAEMLRLATTDVADHVERFMAVYQHALHDPADDGVYEALVRHFTDYGLAFIARSTHPDLPDANHQVIAQFVAHGFAGAIRAWLGDDSVTKADLVEAAVACAPVWWS